MSTLVPHQDGTANVEVAIDKTLDRNAPYAVTVQRSRSAEQIACGTLAFEEIH
jgi:hypothetical protein